MKNIKIITRADDAGSSRSANAAIAKALTVGFIKNVSLMAPGAYINEAAQQLRDAKGVCFGLHTTLNAEWDNVKWGPLSKLDRASGLTDKNGFFLNTPVMFRQTKPCADTALHEYNAQLDLLTKLGFNITYVDSHMYEEIFIEGLSDAKRDWATKKGLLHHGDYNNSPKGINEEETMHNFGRFLHSLPDGQYLYVAHPALHSSEMLQTGNADFSGQEVAKMRDLEARVISDPKLVEFAKANGITTLRYDEAVSISR